MKRSKSVCKVLSSAMAAGIMAGLLWGCAEKKIDYELDSQQGQADATGGLAEFAEAEKWSDEWELELGDGKKISMVIDAEISVPDVDAMSVIEVEKLQLDHAARKQLLEAFFGGEEIYYHDMEHQTREDLKDSIEKLEADISISEEYLGMLGNQVGSVEAEENEYLEGLKQDLERDKEKLLRYQEALETAADAPVPAEDYGSCQEFISYVNGIRYDIRFPEEGEDAVITIEPGELHGGAPTYFPEALSELKECDYAHCYSSGEAEADNECPLSREDAREIADRFIGNSGLPDLVCSKEENLMWSGWNESDGEGAVDREHIYGYCFSYEFGVNGMSFMDFGDEWCYLGSVWSLPDDYYSLGSHCLVEVTDDGVIGMTLYYPLVVKKVTENVELMPMETIQQIMKNEATEHTDLYDFNTYRYSNAMDLIYFRVRDREDSDSYSYIPAWRLSQMGSSCFHPILVNAIDGSVIYVKDEL